MTIAPDFKMFESYFVRKLRFGDLFLIAFYSYTFYVFVRSDSIVNSTILRAIVP